MAASVAAVEPLPLVPAMRTEGKLGLRVAERAGEGAHVVELEFAAGGRSVRGSVRRVSRRWCWVWR